MSGASNNYEKRESKINGVPVTVTTYRVGETWHAVVANVQPGANVARASAATMEEAVSVVTEKAKGRIKQVG